MKWLRFLLALIPAAAFAQGPGVIQSGTITPGHFTSWSSNGVIQDSGVASTGPGTGNVQGPGSSTVGYLPQWANGTGSLLSNGVPVGTTGVSTVIKTLGSGLLDVSIMPVIPNSKLQNSSLTVAGHTVSLGGSTGIAYSDLSSGAPTATSSALGLVKPDNSTITISGGILSASHAGTVTAVSCGTGLTGGTITVSGTCAIANTGVVAGSYTYMSATVNAQGQLTSASNGSAPGNVFGPGSATSGHIATFNGSTGKIIQDSGVSAQNLLNVVNVLNYGADPTCASDSTSAIQNAINTTKTVYIPKGCYKITSDITVTQKSQIIYGDGIGCYSTLSGVCTSGPVGTVLYASAAGGFTNGLFVYTPGLAPYEPGPSIRDLTITAAQPDTAVRANLNAYPPFIKALAIPRFQLIRVKLSQCIVCLDMRGNSGGAYIVDSQFSGYGTKTTGDGLIKIDGSLDTVRFQGIHVWTFDMTANQISIMTNANTVGLLSGRMDDLIVSDSLFLVGVSMQFFYGLGGTSWSDCPTSGFWYCGPTFGTITNTDFDTYSGIVADGYVPHQGAGPTLDISNSQFNLGTSSVFAINATAGFFTLSGISMQQGNAGPTMVLVAGSSDTPAALIWTGGYILQGANDTTVVAVAGTPAGVATAVISGLSIIRNSAGTYSNPVIDIAQAARANVTNNYISDVGGGGSGTFISVANDGFNVVMGNVSPGWTNSFPSATYGIYTCNTVGASPVCGTATGGGNTTSTGGSNTAFVSIFTSNTGITASPDLADFGNIVYPPLDNTTSLGKPGTGINAWAQVNSYAYNTVSDARWKEDVKDETLGCAFVDRVRPVTYHWKNKDDGEHHGILAQEIEVALAGTPFAGLFVPQNSEGRYTLNYEELIGPIMKCAKERGEQNRALAASLEQLSAKVDRLERQWRRK